MKTSVGVFHKRNEALEAVKVLKKHNFPLKKISILGSPTVEEDHVEKDEVQMKYNVPVIAGAIVGPIIGFLSGVGVFAIPGFHPLYGAGAAIGLMAGLGLGIALGGIITLFMTLKFSSSNSVAYVKRMKGGRFLLIVKGSMQEIDHAKQILHSENMDMIHTHH